MQSEAPIDERQSLFFIIIIIAFRETTTDTGARSQTGVYGAKRPGPFLKAGRADRGTGTDSDWLASERPALRPAQQPLARQQTWRPERERDRDSLS